MLKSTLDAVRMQLHRMTLTPAYPVFANLIVTWRCNYKCVMCNNWKRPIENGLEPGEVDKLLKSRWLRNLEIVSVTGGEPFLRDDLEDIIEVIKKYKIPKIGITTNASMPERIRDLLERVAKGSKTRFWLHMSLDGKPETHNRIRGSMHAYGNIVKTIRLVKNLQLENVDLAVGLCISKINVNEINFVRSFAKHHDLYLVVGLAEQGWIFGQKGTGDNLYCFSKEEQDAIIREMRKIGTWYTKGVIRRLSGVRTPLSCTAFWHGFTVAPNGNIHPCVNLPYVVGNIRQTSFDDVWTGRKARQVRKIVKTCKGCWSNCEMNYTRRYSLQAKVWSLFRVDSGFNLLVKPKP